jgi:hypothetical protein
MNNVAGLHMIVDVLIHGIPFTIDIDMVCGRQDRSGAGSMILFFDLSGIRHDRRYPDVYAQEEQESDARIDRAFPQGLSKGGAFRGVFREFVRGHILLFLSGLLSIEIEKDEDNDEASQGAHQKPFPIGFNQNCDHGFSATPRSPFALGLECPLDAGDLVPLQRDPVVSVPRPARTRMRVADPVLAGVGWGLGVKTPG